MPNFGLLNDRPWSVAIVNCLSPIPLPNSSNGPSQEQRRKFGTSNTPKHEPNLLFEPQDSSPFETSKDSAVEVNNDDLESDLPVQVKLTRDHWRSTGVIRPCRGRVHKLPAKCQTVFAVLSGGDVGSQWPLIDREQLHTELKAQNFDKIRFATYRTACKLRFIQKKVYFHLVDIYNVIEAFRENNLHGDALNGDSEVSIGKLESTLSTVYYYLNKRLPSTHQLNVDQALSMLMGWILGAYDPDFSGSVKIISIKVALSTLCSGKYVDKLKYVFENLVSDPASVGGGEGGSCLNTTKFDNYLKQVLALPTSVHEGPSFGYEAQSSLKSCFPPQFSQPTGGQKVKINDYLDTMFADPGPQCLLWLPLMHRMANVENVLHPISCSFCNCESMMGFRYKCQRCPNYQLCQTCFWYGQASGSHSNDHEMKEYSTYKSPAKQFTHTLRKGTMKCLPTTNKLRGTGDGAAGSPDGKQSYGVESVDGPSLNLQHIIPAQPVTEYGAGSGALGGGAFSQSLIPANLRDPALIAHYERLTEAIESSGGKMDDEHRLIARYAAKLAQETLNSLSGRPATHVGNNVQNNNFDMNRNQKQREILADLHQKNRDIMREIARLKEERDETSRMSNLAAAAAGGMHPMVSGAPGGAQFVPGARGLNNPSVVHELRSLRQRKEELEQRMACLQESRRELMVQLESLMKMLRTSQNGNQVPSSNHSQTLANFSSNSTTTGSSPNNSGHYNQHKMGIMSPAHYNASSSTTAPGGPAHPSDALGYAPQTQQHPQQSLQRGIQSSQQQQVGNTPNQQLHQELLISAENASHAAIDLLSKLSLRMAPDVDPSAINAFAYYPYTQQPNDPSLGSQSTGASMYPQNGSVPNQQMSMGMGASPNNPGTVLSQNTLPNLCT